MDLHYLEYIIEIAKCRSISRAAEVLCITQSTLSQYLSKVESDIGVKLFDRQRNGMSLTPAGVLYVETSKRMLQEKKELYNEIADITKGQTGSFTVGITPHWGSMVIASIMGKFRSVYPGVTIKIKEDTSEPLARSLQEGSIDMAIMPLVDNSSVIDGSLLLQTEPLVMAIPSSWAESVQGEDVGASFPVLSVEILRDKPMVLSRGDTTIRKLEDQCFEKAGIKPNVVASLNSHMGAIMMAKNEVGGTFVPLSFAIKTEGVSYFLPIPEIHWSVVISFKRDYHLHKSEKYFIQLVQEHFSS
ncbi:MAG: LysR substrate-binding domain-containing protein [Candidatus Ornithospirochaeta sp.]